MPVTGCSGGCGPDRVNRLSSRGKKTVLPLVPEKVKRWPAFTNRWLLCAGFMCLTAAGVNADTTAKGSARLELNGGSRGSVHFPHAQHQEKLSDCSTCHGDFPKAKGAIDALKAEGVLQPKQIMNRQCIQCHLAKRRMGEPAGPLTCRSCHLR